jgi:Lar family restriction alleviation protein
MSKKAIKPCPFCGSSNLHEEKDFPFFVHCAGCATDGPLRDDADTSREAWNTRQEGATA